MSSGERLVFFDLETAGPKADVSIIQIAAIAVDSELEELESFQGNVRLEKSTRTNVRNEGQIIEPAIWKRLASQPDHAATEFAKFLRRHATIDMTSKHGKPYQLARLAAHNATFDGPLLIEWYKSLGLFLPATRAVYCTLQRAYWLFEEDKSLAPPTDYKLATLCEYFGIHLARHEAHNAMADVQATVKLYRAIVDWVHFEDIED